MNIKGNMISENMAWSIYLISIGLSFFVMIEPAPSDLVFFLALFALLLAPIRRVRFLNGYVVLGIVLYLLFSVVSLFFVKYYALWSIRAVLIEFYMIGLFCMTAYFCFTKGDLAFHKIMLAYMIGAIFCCFIGYLALADIVPNSHIFFRGEAGERNRLMSTFKDPNVLGPFLVAPVLFAVWMSVGSEKWRGAYLAAFAFMLAILVATLSRGAMIHMAITLLVFGTVLLVHPKSAFRTFVFILVSVIVGQLIILLYLDRILEMLEGTIFAQRLSLQSYDDRRFAVVIEAVGLIFDRPLGIGPGQVRYVYTYLPHNTFVAFAMHNGVFACLGLILIYVSAMVRCASKIFEKQPGWTKYGFIFSILIGLLVLMQVVGAIHWRHLYLVCGLAFGQYNTDLPYFEKPQLRNLRLRRA